jgi:DNA-directed RNA polymerase specialized sigma24 family protein
MLGYLCARLPSLVDAEDLRSEVFPAALSRKRQGDEPRLGWLLIVARRRAADFHRARSRASRYVVAQATAESIRLPLAEPSTPAKA